MPFNPNVICTVKLLSSQVVLIQLMRKFKYRIYNCIYEAQWKNISHIFKIYFINKSSFSKYNL